MCASSLADVQSVKWQANWTKRSRFRRGERFTQQDGLRSRETPGKSRIARVFSLGTTTKSAEQRTEQRKRHSSLFTLLYAETRRGEEEETRRGQQKNTLPPSLIIPAAFRLFSGRSHNKCSFSLHVSRSPDGKQRAGLVDDAGRVPGQTNNERSLLQRIFSRSVDLPGNYLERETEREWVVPMINRARPAFVPRASFEKSETKGARGGGSSFSLRRHRDHSLCKTTEK